MATALIWQDERILYDFGPDHPLKPIRVELTVSLIRACGFTDREGVLTLPREPFTTDDVLRIHTEQYVDAVRKQSADPDPYAPIRHGLGLGDNPVFRGMHEASLEVCGASVAAAKAVWEGTAIHAFNPAGGLHHAMPDRASGFCIYDDPAFAIDWLLRHGAERVAYLDVDTHHGDGPQEIFYDDPRVLTVSLHESGRYLFPGTGFPNEIGAGDAVGTSLNVPLEPATPGDVWFEAFEAVVPPALDAFRPQVIVTQLGCDTHVTDPLAHLALTTDDYTHIAQRLHALAHEHSEGRWVATGGGGYRLATVVPRAWTIYFAELAGAELPIEVPWPWLHEAEEATGERPPEAFLDGPVRMADERRGMVRSAAFDAVETLKTSAFEQLERHT
ncbi:acetoin utilization protein AcuC [Egibacter rhizosphaerae]|uniref:Acetoin utilization protein AcuC n=1 Tax=Egibacter rhizosphaerae TaxID=1670831 RepID=A0A411YGC7_9ACTN|nr:acetoin utilization protein AcuC [Egibacter rhizosphaerae]QBI20314.1 acetoin utilization protein AcuC [Egibacter rhizosphaerae]